MAQHSASSDPAAWDGLPPIPIRVLVKGASSTVVVEPPGGPRTNQAFAWWLEAMLRAGGFEATVRNAGSEGQRVTRAVCNWEAEVQQWAPDAVVLNYGQYECMPGLLPYFLERHATGWHRHSGPFRERYRRRVADPIWRKLARYQRRAPGWLVAIAPFRSSPKRTLTELRFLIDKIRTVGTPLVIVMETWPVGSRWRHWFPTMHESAVKMREEIENLVSGYGSSDVYRFPMWELVGGLDLDKALPDGVHFSGDLHRKIAEGLSAVVLEWASQQPHLRHPGATVTDSVQRGISESHA
jgi:hypothetical protein